MRWTLERLLLDKDLLEKINLFILLNFLFYFQVTDALLDPHCKQELWINTP